MTKCVICGEEVPPERSKKDTCSDVCGMKKMQAWIFYLRDHKDEIIKSAIEEFKAKHEKVNS